MVSRVMARMVYLLARDGFDRKTEMMLPPWLPVAPKMVRIFLDILGGYGVVRV